MKDKVHIVVVIPAFNEENAVGKVISEIPKDWVKEIIVCDNNSSDKTTESAKNAGAIVVHENRQGYGYACLKCLDFLKENNISPDIVVFLDADYSDYPEELPKVVQPIIGDDCDLITGQYSSLNRSRYF